MSEPKLGRVEWRKMSPGIDRVELYVNGALVSTRRRPKKRLARSKKGAAA